MMERILSFENDKYIELAAEEVKRNVKWVESVGVELEGGVPESAVRFVQNKLETLGLDYRFEWGFDGSVSVPKPPYIRDRWCSDAELRFWIEINRIEVLFDVIDVLWKLGFRQNSTCGNHVHLKFINNLQTLSLIFNEEFVKEFEKRYRIYARARGEKYERRIDNHYCEFYKFHKYPAALYYYCTTRYRAVNFRSVDENETLEIRVLPYAENAIEYIDNLIWLLRVVDNIVDKIVKKVEKTGKVISVRVGFPRIRLPKEEEIIEEFEV
ncbi:MAG: amidoligase family protein [Thermofilum sp.]|nr:amidoligase family protein [Thermofilum sp.]